MRLPGKIYYEIKFFKKVKKILYKSKKLWYNVYIKRRYAGVAQW